MYKFLGNRLLITFLFLIPISSYAQSVDLWIEGGKTVNGNTCIVTASAKNNTRITIGFIGKLNFYDSSNNLISLERPLIENLRPTNTTSTVMYVRNITCQEITKISYRGLDICMVNGEAKYNSCPFDVTLPKNKGVMDIQN